MSIASSFDFDIVIPCYNEAENLPRLIEECSRIVKLRNCGFILVDNGSTDGSNEILSSLIKAPGIRFLTLDENIGYGNGIFNGLLSSKANFLGWMHADMQVGLDNLLLIPEFLEQSTIYKGHRKERNRIDGFITGGMSALCSLILRKSLNDINGQPTIISRTLFEKLSSPPKDFNFDLYVFYMAKKFNFKVQRFKVILNERIFGESKWNKNLYSRIRLMYKVVIYSLRLRIIDANN
jgi:glycosyltransferase involved in cell wall biosynthesis